MKVMSCLIYSSVPYEVMLTRYMGFSLSLHPHKREPFSSTELVFHVSVCNQLDREYTLKGSNLYYYIRFSVLKVQIILQEFCGFLKFNLMV